MAEPTSIKQILVAELNAIKDRLQKATGNAEKELLNSQFGQRLEHLAERIKGLPDPAPKPAPPTPPAAK